MENLIRIFRIEHSKLLDSFGFYDSELRYEDRYNSLTDIHNTKDYPDIVFGFL